MSDRGFRNLPPQPHGRIESGGGALSNVGDSPAAYLTDFLGAQRRQVLAVKDDPTAGYSATGSRVSKGGKADRGLTCPGFSDESDHLARLQLQAHRSDYGSGRGPLGTASAADFNGQVLDTENRRHLITSVSAVLAAKIQSTTKFTPIVSCAIAIAG